MKKKQIKKVLDKRPNDNVLTTQRHNELRKMEKDYAQLLIKYANAMEQSEGGSNDLAKAIAANVTLIDDNAQLVRSNEALAEDNKKAFDEGSVIRKVNLKLERENKRLSGVIKKVMIGIVVFIVLDVAYIIYTLI